ncbi:hypothetical protein GCM10008940_25900 [Microbulbifer agarilyticus]
MAEHTGQPCDMRTPYFVDMRTKTREVGQIASKSPSFLHEHTQTDTQIKSWSSEFHSNFPLNLLILAKKLISPRHLPA